MAGRSDQARRAARIRALFREGRDEGEIAAMVQTNLANVRRTLSGMTRREASKPSHSAEADPGDASPDAVPEPASGSAEPGKSGPQRAGTAKTTGKELDPYVGARLRLLRKANGMTQTQLAEHLGLSFQQVQKCENGDNQINAARLYFLAQRFGVNVGWFFSETHASPNTGANPNAVFAQIVQEEAPEDFKRAGFTSSRELARLVSWFQAISDPEVRQEILEISQSLAASADTENSLGEGQGRA